VELAELAARANYPVWLPWGSEQEKERAEEIARQASDAQVLPRLDLLGLASMLLEVNGAVAVDTGLGHLAAALDVPTVSLYGPTSTHLIGAYGRNQVHIQSALGSEDTDDPMAMMRSISAEQVWCELQAILPGAG
jgi:heptosyltransferase-1